MACDITNLIPAKISQRKPKLGMPYKETCSFQRKMNWRKKI